MFGVMITSGLKDWQIVQQIDGAADFHLEGTYQRQNSGDYAEIYVRVVREDSGENVIFWTPANIYTDDMTWEITLKNVPAGGLYRIESCLRENPDIQYEWGLRGDSIQHVGVGDVYLIAGQSNAAGYGKDIIYDPPMIGVHVLRNSGKWDLAAHPLNDSTNTQSEVNMDPSNTGSSPYLSFAKNIYQRVGYPIGLIPTALGGSPLSRWNPDEVGDLYENMIRRVCSQGGSVKAVLWYQGCSDTNVRMDAVEYTKRFGNMVEHMRKDLESPDLPVFTFQISRFTTPPASMKEDFSWSIVRQAQREAAKSIKNVYLLPTIDGTLSDMIHNSASFNLVLGDRLARQVMARIYHQDQFWAAPDLQKIRMSGPDELSLSFAPIYDRLYACEIQADELPFHIMDEQGVIQITGYKLPDRNTISLQLEREMQGEVQVCAYYGQNPRCRCVIDFATHYPILGFIEKINTAYLGEDGHD